MNIRFAANTAAVPFQGGTANTVQTGCFLYNGQHVLTARQDAGTIVDWIVGQPEKAVILCCCKAGVIFLTTS